MGRLKILIIIFAAIVVSFSGKTQTKHSCSTFMILKGDSVLIGHNLDDYIDVLGIIVINKRGVQKTNISWIDLRKGWKEELPRLTWVSKYGSITYNTMGREFIDGGLNEAGLYIGEMTLMETQFPTDEATPKIYHNFWMQFQLDNYASVDEVLQNLHNVIIDGHCKWHFFVADKQGNSATIEYLNGKAVIHTNQSMPYKILCNSKYSSDLDSLKLYKGYGGSRIINLNDKENTKRTVRGTYYLDTYQQNSKKSLVAAGFELLNLLDLGNNKWKVIYDLKNMKMYFNTYKSEVVKELSFSSCNFSDGRPQFYFDIHTCIKGDISGMFAELNFKTNKKYVRRFWKEVNFGFFGNIFIKPFVIWRLSNKMTLYSSKFTQN